MNSSSNEARLKAALADMFAMIDEGLLVRNIEDDGEPGWHLLMLKFVQRLQRNREALDL